MTYSFALGVAVLALPLFALDVGYSPAVVGALTASSALAQMTTRMGLGAVMRRIPDWWLVFAAGGILAASCALVVWSTTMASFVACELLQGVSRACFWTGAQTHVVRAEGSSVGRLAAVNLVSSAGRLAAPAAAGAIAQKSFVMAFGCASGVGVAAMIAPLLLDRLPPFAPRSARPPGRLWKQPEVNTGCRAGVTVGSWRGLIASYVPVILQHAGYSSTTIGVLVSAANSASVVGAAAVARVHTHHLSAVAVAGTFAAGSGLTVLPFSTMWASLAGVMLVTSGLGNGALQTLGPAIAADGVHPEQRGDAIAMAGTFRAGGLLASPLAVAGLLALVPLAPALSIVSGLIAASTVRWRYPKSIRRAH